MFYTISALSQGIDEEAMYGGSSTAAMMGLGVFVIGLFAVLFLFYTNSFIMKRRKKEIGLYNILGMEKRHIANILFRDAVSYTHLDVYKRQLQKVYTTRLGGAKVQALAGVLSLIHI